MGERQRDAARAVPGRADLRATRRFEGYDAAVLMEVVEHVDPPRLPALEHVVFGQPARARPRDHAERRVQRPLRGAAPGMRHPDHRFEWTRAEFAALVPTGVATAHGYDVEFRGVGADDAGGSAAPTQLGVFTRRAVTDQRSPQLGAGAARRRRPAAASRRSRAQHFAPYEVISSDFCRGLVTDDENDQAATTRRVRRAALHRRHAARGAGC